MNSRCLCSFKTVWFSKKQSICQSVRKKYDIKENFNDSDINVNFKCAYSDFSQSFLINEDVCLRIEEKTVWDITNLTKTMMKFCKSFVQWWSEMFQNDFNWWVNKTAWDEICWFDMNIMSWCLNDKKKMSSEWEQTSWNFHKNVVQKM